MIRSGTTVTNGVTGERVTFLETASTTNGERLVFDNYIAAGTPGPPPHVHPLQEERFEVLDGQFFATLNREKRTFSAGQSFVVPPGAAHTFQALPNQDATFRVTLSPALDSEEFFVGVTDAANRRGAGAPSLMQLAALQIGLTARFYLAGPPVWAQDILFRVLGRISRMLKLA